MIVSPLLFNSYLNDLFLLLQDKYNCSFADSTTPFVYAEKLESVLDKLEGNSELAIFWFESNHIKLNTDKCHLPVS